jgi:hypothetical protein
VAAVESERIQAVAELVMQWMAFGGHRTIVAKTALMRIH